MPTAETEKENAARSLVARNRLVAELLESEGADKREAEHILRIMDEFKEGFALLRTCEFAASFFGSARCTLGDNIYEDTKQLAGRLSKAGFAIITGGGGGVMRAANHGAYEAGGRSIGFNIKIPEGQPLNEFVTDSLTFRHFFTRKVMLAYASEVYIFLPGGFGTLDEFSEMVTLIQTKKVKRVPIVLLGKDYWTPYTDLFRTHLYEKYHTIDKEDLDIYHLVDSVDEAYALITKLVPITGQRSIRQDTP